MQKSYKKKNANTHIFQAFLSCQGKKKKKGVKNIIKIFYLKCHTGRHSPAEETKFEKDFGLFVDAFACVPVYA